MMRSLLALWTLGIVAVMTLPFSNFQGHAHWEAVNWIPFAGQYDELGDMVLNTLVFVPFGYLHALQARSGRRRLVHACGLAMALSVAGELYQVFCHARIVSATDVVTNTLGTLVGVLLAGPRD